MLIRRLAILIGAGIAVLSPVAAAQPPAAPPQPTAGPPQPTAGYTTKNAWSFVSAPGLTPPKLIATRPIRAKQLDPGYFMLSSFKNLTQTKTPMAGQGGPLLLDNRLRPVWFQPDCPNQTACASQDIWSQDLEQQTFEGKPVLSWWQGALSAVGVSETGKLYVVDQHYRTVATLVGADGWIVDSHDLVISGHNAWVTMTRRIPMNLVPYGGSAQGSIIDTPVQEYDLRTGALLYTWDPLQHIPLSDSYQPLIPGIPWDAYHINSIQLGHGTFLAGFRNTWAAYQVNIKTQAIEWTLGGKHSSFRFGRGAAFSWQHNVVLGPHGIVSAFDDECCAITGVKNGAAQFMAPNGAARGLVLALNLRKHTASLVRQYVRGKRFHVYFTGSMQLLPSGNAVVGWGSAPFFTEYSRSGKVLLDAQWPNPDLSYRADARLTQSWVGRPFYPPSGAVGTGRHRTTVYASWNGATGVQVWQVLAGRDAKHLKLVASAPANGFETAIRLRRSYRAYKVRAVDSHGHLLRSSGVFPTPPGPKS